MQLRRAAPAFARLVEWAVIGLSYLALPAWPFAAAWIARDGSFLRHYAATLAQTTRHLSGALKGRSVSRFVLQKMVPQPVSAAVVSGSCTHCGNCCLYRGCLFLQYDGAGQSRCRIYGGRVWKLLACGDYPATAREIELYACPSFAAAAVPDRRGRVIPIVPASVPALATGTRTRRRAARADGE